jgi:hypothetical protein
LAENYAGYFSTGDTRELARLMARAESDSEFLADLKSQCARLAPLFSPERELATWKHLIR